MLVARSNPELPKHKGLTYFALDMHAPGVEVRPLRQITGEAEFNEVYMTDVRVPDSARIGAVGEGWRVALTTLMNERTAIGGAVGGATTAQQGPLGNLMEAYRNMDPAVRTKAHRDEVMQLWVRGEALRLTNIRAAQNARAGNPGPEGSVSKLMLAEFNKELTSKVIDLEGAAALVDYDYEFRRPTAISLDGKFGDSHHGFLRARANSHRGRHQRDHAQHPGRAGAGPPRRAQGGQGDPLARRAPQLAARELAAPEARNGILGCRFPG